MVFEAFPDSSFDSAQDDSISLWKEEEAINEHQTHFGETDDYPDFDPLSSDLGSFHPDKSSDELHPLSALLVPDALQIDAATMASFQEIMALHARLESNHNTQFSTPAFQSKEEKSKPILLTSSLEILHNYRTGNRILPTAQESPPRRAPVRERRRSSTVEIVRTAGSRYIQLFETTVDDLSFLAGSPFNSLFSDVGADEIRGIHLAYVLLSSAEKIHNRQFDRASRLLEHCEALASHNGDAVQRVVFYFAVALRERINRETGRAATKGGERCCMDKMEEERMNPSSTLLACHQKLPFSRVMQFTSIQAIIDSVAAATRVHLVDLGIGLGVQWSILMQALAERKGSRPVQLLRITAVGTLEEQIAVTGKRLTAFAQMLSLPFRFKAVVVPDMMDLQPGMLEVEADEAVAVHAPIVLSTMIVRPECLEKVMRVVRDLNPCVVSVVEVEGNHNAASFVNRFTEALFFFSAWFDCVDTCMERDDCDRLAIEGSFLFWGIQSIVAAEGSERMVRHVKLEVWRAYFRRFGFVEAELSELSLYQAKLLVKQFGCENHFMLEMNGKGLVIGWKGTPLHCLSVWKLR